MKKEPYRCISLLFLNAEKENILNNNNKNIELIKNERK
jgi:hypothetical protein